MAGHARHGQPAGQALAELEYARSVQWYMDAIFKGRYPALALKHADASALAIFENDFIDIRQPIDFLGVNYYTRAFMSAETPPQARMQAGRQRHGLGNLSARLDGAAVGLHREYRLPPVYITENGMAVNDKLVDGKVHDEARIEYVWLHLEGLARRDRPGHRRARLFLLEPDGQLRVELGLCQALRHAVRRLRHSSARSRTAPCGTATSPRSARPTYRPPGPGRALTWPPSPARHPQDLRDGPKSSGPGPRHP
jgi:hypothetical protein